MSSTKLLNKIKNDYLQQYQEGVITDDALSTLAALDRNFAKEAAAKILSCMGISQAGSLMPDGALWVSVENIEEAMGVKQNLKDNGYYNVRTFEGWMYGGVKARMIVQGSKSIYFSDPQGRGEKLYTLAYELGVAPLYAYASNGTLSIDLESEDHALAMYAALKAHGLPDVEVRPDAMNSFDVWQVAVKAA
jgi:hypothetical protein